MSIHVEPYVLLGILLLAQLVALCMVAWCLRRIVSKMHKLRLATEVMGEGLDIAEKEVERQSGRNQASTANKDRSDLREFVRSSSMQAGDAAGFARGTADSVASGKVERARGEREGRDNAARDSGSAPLDGDFQRTVIPGDEYTKTVVMKAVKGDK